MSAQRSWISVAYVVALPFLGGCDGCTHVSEVGSAGGGTASGAGGTTNLGGGAGGGLVVPNVSVSVGAGPIQCADAGASWSGGGGASPEPSRCEHLVADDALLTFGEPGQVNASPNLVALGGGRFALAFVTKSAGDYDGELEIATFDASGAWPPADAPKTKATTPWNHGTPLRLQSLFLPPNAGKGQIRLFFEDRNQADGGLTALTSRGCVNMDFRGDDYTGEPLYLFNALGADAGQFGRSVPGGAGYTFQASTFGEGAGSNFGSVSCATTPIAADVAPLDGSYLLAVASGSALLWGFGPDPCISTPENVIGPATTLRFGKITTEGTTFDAISTLTTPATVTHVRFSTSPVGRWAAWGMADGSFAAARFDGSLTMTTLAPSLPVEMAVDSFDAHALGTGFAVVSVAAGAVELATLSSAGALGETASFPLTGTASGRVVMNAPASLDSALVAWSEVLADATVVHVGRVRCVE